MIRITLILPLDDNPMTNNYFVLSIFAVDMNLADFYTVAVTHKNFSIKNLGKLHIDETVLKTQLTEIKQKLQLKELVYLSTCNRVEILFVSSKPVDKNFLINLFSSINKDLKPGELKKLVTTAEIYNSHEAVNHTLRVASSLESLVVGEREIITQFRQAYEKCCSFGLTADFMRLLNKHTVETAKQIFTETNIAKNPVSPNASSMERSFKSPSNSTVFL